MLTVTAAASARPAQLLKQPSMPEEIAVRFVYEGRTVLPLDAQVSELLAEDTFDLVGAKLMLKRPKEGEKRRQ